MGKCPNYFQQLHMYVPKGKILTHCCYDYYYDRVNEYTEQSMLTQPLF